MRVGTEPTMDLSCAAVVVFTDARQVLHRRVLRQLSMIWKRRAYGFLGPEADLSRREWLVVEASLGPVVGRLGVPDDHLVEIQAGFADWPGGEQPDRPLGLEWKRASIWHSAGRNLAIARLARALAGGDAEIPWDYGLFDFLDPQLREGRRVAILVESTEHADVLARLLPGWCVLRAEPSGSSGTHRAEGPTRHSSDMPPQAPNRSIITWLAAWRRGGIQTDVVIRADGTPWPLDLPLWPASHGQGVGRPVLLVDLADGQDRTAGRQGTPECTITGTGAGSWRVGRRSPATSGPLMFDELRCVGVARRRPRPSRRARTSCPAPARGVGRLWAATMRIVRADRIPTRPDSGMIFA